MYFLPSFYCHLACNLLNIQSVLTDGVVGKQKPGLTYLQSLDRGPSEGLQNHDNLATKCCRGFSEQLCSALH